MNATSLTNEVKRQIKNFNDGCAHELSETIEQVKLALNDRSSDGKSFVISDKSIRQKLKYHYEKAVAAILRSSSASQRELVPLNQESEECIPEVPPSVDLINPLPVDVPQPADDDDRVPQGLLNELITQIKRFKEGSTNSLSETIEEAKKALDKRSSDGKSFVISDTFRHKLKYHCEKAVAAILRSSSASQRELVPVEITSQRRQFFQEDVDKFGKQWQDTFVFYSCSHCVYTGPRTDFFHIDDCDPYILLLYKLVKQEYFAKLRSSGIREIRMAADVLEGQLTAGGAFPGATLIYFICL